MLASGLEVAVARAPAVAPVEGQALAVSVAAGLPAALGSALEGRAGLAAVLEQVVVVEAAEAPAAAVPRYASRLASLARSRAPGAAAPSYPASVASVPPIVQRILSVFRDAARLAWVSVHPPAIAVEVERAVAVEAVARAGWEAPVEGPVVGRRAAD
jgi:hypothetical protein